MAGAPSGPLMIWMLVRAFIAFLYLLDIDYLDLAVPIGQNPIVADAQDDRRRIGGTATLGETWRLWHNSALRALPVSDLTDVD